MQEEVTTMQPVQKEEKSGFKARMITAAVYLVCWVALISMKWLVPLGNVDGGWGSLGFDAVFCAISIIGSFEFLRAVNGVSYPQKVITMAFSVMIVPLYVAIQLTMRSGLLGVAVAFTVYTMFLMATSVFDPLRSTVKGTITCVFCMLYCGVLSTMLSALNHLAQNSMAAILLLFMTTVLCDTCAFVFGSLLKRFLPWKLSPKLSPNKTIVGAVGGLIGGIIGAILAYTFIYYFGGINGNIIYVGFNNVYLTFTSQKIHPIVTFTLVGLATSVLAQIGDLFESAIKRECGIKDMGKLLPGHGGILDRFDSMLYCSVVVLLSFGTIII